MPNDDPSKCYITNINYVCMSNQTVYGLSQRCTIYPLRIEKYTFVEIFLENMII